MGSTLLGIVLATIAGAQAVGFISGEWRDIGGKPRAQIILAIALLILAVAVMVYARRLSG